MEKIYLKICPNEWENASRDKRELSVCKELGYNVLVLAKGRPKDKGRQETVDCYNVIRYTTRPLGKSFPVKMNRIITLFVWAHYARKIKPDVISGHDIKGLFIGWLSNIFSRHKAKLVYDSHEFELGRNKKRNAVQKMCIKMLEGYLINKCAVSIMVNESIAEEVQHIYRLKEKPIVVRSTPNYWEIDENTCIQKRAEILDQFVKNGYEDSFN